MDDDLLADRLCRLCATPSGRLPGLRFHDHGARAAMLIDLALCHRVARSASGELTFSTTPTGVAAADKMLAHIGRHAGGTVQSVLAKAPGRMSDVLQRDGQNRRWFARSPRIDQHEVEAERNRLDQAAAGEIDSPQSAALAMLADALRLVTLEDSPTVLGECGDIAGIVEDCVNYLLLVRYRYELTVAAGSGGGG